MMTSISENGLDPGDSFYVIAQEGDENYTAVDGNRRLSALKLLKNPEITKRLNLTSGLTKQILSISKEFDKNRYERLDCVLFDSREQANAWILRRHGRGMDGEGRIAWGTLEIERFKRDGSILDIIDFVERNAVSDEASLRGMKAKLRRASSTLRRIIESKRGREWFGITIEENDGSRTPYFTLDASVALNILQKIFSDIESKSINTRKLNTSDEIDKYLEGLPTEIKPKPADRGISRTFREADTTKRKTSGTAKSTGAKSNEKKTIRAPSIRTTLAPRNLSFKIPETEKGKQLIREATQLNLISFPLGCAFILRSFIEHTIDTYMTRNKLPLFEKGSQLDLAIRADRTVNHLVQNGTPMKSLQGVRTILTSKADPASIKSLNHYHHDHYQVPGADTLRKAWDAIEPLYVAVYGVV